MVSLQWKINGIIANADHTYEELCGILEYANRRSISVSLQRLKAMGYVEYQKPWWKAKERMQKASQTQTQEPSR